MIPVTALTGYLFCPRKIWLGYVAKEKPKIEFMPTVLGSIRHNAMDKAAKFEDDILTTIKPNYTPEDIQIIYRQYYMKAVNLSIIQRKKEIENAGITMQDALNSVSEQMTIEAKIRAKYVTEFIAIKKCYGEELKEKMQPKIISEFYIDAYKLGLNGSIDKIEKYGNVLVPMEMKTGTAPREGVWDNHRIQIAAYIMMLNEKYRQEIKEGYILYENERRKVILNPFLEDEIKLLIEKVNALIKSEKIPKILDNEKKCSKCNLFENCRNYITN